MKVTEQTIRERALERISEIFNVPVTQLRMDTKFEDMKVSFVSDWRDNEYDELLNDNIDVADRKIIKEINKGLLLINSVSDYCDHMVRCYATRPKIVSEILKLPMDDYGDNKITGYKKKALFYLFMTIVMSLVVYWLFSLSRVQLTLMSCS